MSDMAKGMLIHFIDLNGLIVLKYILTTYIQFMSKPH